MNDSTKLKLATLIILGLIVVAAITGITVVAIFTDRDLTNVERLVFGVVIMMALIGGLSIYVDRVRIRRRDDSGQGDQ